MTITWEHFIPIIITVAGGLIVWAIKIAINAIAASITKKVEEAVRRHDARLEAGEARMDAHEERIKKNEADTGFLFKTLIERNS